MKALAEGTCCTVTAPSDMDGQCCDASGDDYCPTYGDITGGTYANVRVTSSNRAADVDGFLVDAPGSGDVYQGSCCSTAPGSDKWCPPRAKLKFGWTKLSGFALNVESVDCDGVYDVRGYATFTVGSKKCDPSAPGGIHSSSMTESHQVMATSGELSMTTEFQGSGDRSDGYDAVNVSFSTYPLSAEYLFRDGTACEKSYSDSITVTGSPYSILFSGDTITEIPCTGGTFVLKLVYDGLCAGPDRIDFTAQFDGEAAPLSKSTDSSKPDDEVWFVVGTNEIGTNSLTVTAYFDEKEVGKVTYKVNRRLCGYSPDFSNDGPCGMAFSEESWVGVDNVEYHAYQGN